MYLYLSKNIIIDFVYFYSGIATFTEVQALRTSPATTEL